MKLARATLLALVLQAPSAGAQANADEITPSERRDADCVDRANAPGGRTIGGAVLVRPSVGGMLTTADDPKTTTPGGFRGLVEAEGLTLGAAAGDAWIAGVTAGGASGEHVSAYDIALSFGGNRRRYGTASIDEVPGHCLQEQHDWRWLVTPSFSHRWRGDEAHSRAGLLGSVTYRYRAAKWGWELNVGAGATMNLDTTPECDSKCVALLLDARGGILVAPFFFAIEGRTSSGRNFAAGESGAIYFELAMFATLGVEINL